MQYYVSGKGIDEMKKLMMLLAGLMIAVLAASCSNAPEQGGEPGGEGAAAEKEAGKKIIGVSLLKENDDFYITLKKGLKAGAGEFGYDIEILSADNDEMKQDRNMDALLLKDVSAIVICPVNSKGVGPIIRKATDKGIPVFTADIAAEKGDVVAHVASDNYQGGQLAARYMAEQVGEGAKIAIVQQPGAESVKARVKGFADEAFKLGLEILKPYLNGKDDTQESERVANSVIIQNSDLAGFFAANDNMAAGVEAAINSSGKDIVLVGYDASPSAQGKIKQGGVWKADVIQYPFEIGRITVLSIDRYFKGDLKPQGGEDTIIVPVKVGLVTQESLTEGAE